MKHQLKKLFVVAGLTIAFVSASQAQWYLAGDFQGWNASSTPMNPGPNAGEYSYTITGGTQGGTVNCKVTDGTFNNTWPSQNMVVHYDQNGNITVHFWPGTATDGWAPYANRVGYDDPGNLSDSPSGGNVGPWGLAGGFDSWDGTQAELPLNPGMGAGVYSNSIVVATAGSYGFKFQNPAGSWSDIYFGQDFGNNNNNGSFATTTSPQTLPVVLDLPNGRYLIGAPAIPPISTITFTLDMTEQVDVHNFTNTVLNPEDPNYGLPVNSVAVAGDFIGWGTGAQLTNYTILYPDDPNPGLKTNWYIGAFQFQQFLPTTINWKFRVNNLDGGYELPISTEGGNRQTLISQQNTVMPVILYDDLGIGDVLLSPCTVMFSLYMPDQTPIIGGGVFNKGTDVPYVNGPWMGWDWGLDSGLVLNEVGTSDVYTNVWTFSAGNSIYVTYKYSADGPDNENGQNTNHIREIRTYGSTYDFPQDVWSWSIPNQSTILTPGLPTSDTNIVEIDFGNLAIGAPSGGNFPITWVGRPGVFLQNSGDLTSGSWSSVNGTDAAQANSWPNNSSVQFFRLMKE